MDEDTEGTFATELRVSLPRNSQLSSPDGWSGVVIGLILLVTSAIFGGCLGVRAFKQVQERAVLRRDGRDMEGIVRRIHAGHGDSIISYTFIVNGVTYHGEAQLPNYHLFLHQSDPIAVRFLPLNPDVNHPVDWEWSGLSDIVPECFVFFFMLIGVAALCIVLRDRMLLRKGMVARGIVIACNRKGSEFRIDYEFRTDDGAVTKGTSDSSDSYETGTEVCILYLPRNCWINDLYPLRYYVVGD